ncbi:MULTISPECIES: hypothetical protein [Sedimentibacter]|nr:MULTISPECIES: hypothetical protein [Sedimentibacter]
MSSIEIRIKAKLSTAEELKDFVRTIRDIEKEHSCNCTLLEIEYQ